MMTGHQRHHTAGKSPQHPELAKHFLLMSLALASTSQKCLDRLIHTYILGHTPISPCLRSLWETLHGDDIPRRFHSPFDNKICTRFGFAADQQVTGVNLQRGPVNEVTPWRPVEVVERPRVPSRVGMLASQGQRAPSKAFTAVQHASVGRSAGLVSVTCCTWAAVGGAVLSRG